MVNRSICNYTIEDLERVIFSDESECIPGKSQLLYDKAQKFKEACELLEIYRNKGLLTYEADNPLRPYFLHCIWIKWNYENDYPEIPTKDMVELLSKMDTLLLDDEGISSDWQLSSKLYVMCD